MHANRMYSNRRDIGKKRDIMMQYPGECERLLSVKDKSQKVLHLARYTTHTTSSKPPGEAVCPIWFTPHAFTPSNKKSSEKEEGLRYGPAALQHGESPPCFVGIKRPIVRGRGGGGG